MPNAMDRASIKMKRGKGRTRPATAACPLGPQTAANFLAKATALEALSP